MQYLDQEARSTLTTLNRGSRSTWMFKAKPSGQVASARRSATVFSVTAMSVSTSCRGSREDAVASPLSSLLDTARQFSQPVGGATNAHASRSYRFAGPISKSRLAQNFGSDAANGSKFQIFFMVVRG